ncbi:MAG: 2-C-methyl-D-erythritol 2,4-cyclodiphosphate synthase [Bacteroidales bacterium]|nr:2-C-methyl-D-erythritol 2,4-cyclodiphosphate synthase [Bacteroidales bacterium]
MKFRTGIGFDVHQLREGIPLWLGGIRIEHTHGLLGHSDADVLIHAICDALLGAAALGDIGQHFPDTDPAYKGIDSKKLLSNVCLLLRQKGYSIGNVDAIICAQKPKLMPHIPAMRQVLSEVMDIDIDDLSIKATTTEHLGFEGRGEGISSYASVLIYKNQ